MRNVFLSVLFVCALLPAFSFTTAPRQPLNVEIRQTGEYVYLTASGSNNNEENFYVSSIVWISGSRHSKENTESREKAKKRFENEIASRHNDSIKYYWFNEKSIASDSKEDLEGKRIAQVQDQKKRSKVVQISL
ncbi:MAG: hypothetical protein EOO16_12250 [Chitinophagaceae bacterium]|nr:MAG: hypothetical protein EOO16_12250 [Chitinophagaceae bacterium]